VIAVVGFAVQALVTRAGPLDNLAAHIADPTSANIFGSIANLPNVISA
jgi:hypothetical protein